MNLAKRRGVALLLLAAVAGLAWETMDPGRVRWLVLVLLGGFAVRVLLSRRAGGELARETVSRETGSGYHDSGSGSAYHGERYRGPDGEARFDAGYGGEIPQALPEAAEERRSEQG